MDPKQLEHLEQACADAEAFAFAGSALEKRVPDGQAEAYAPLRIGLGYHLIDPFNEDGRARAEGAFGPMMEFDGRRFPPQISDLPEATLDAWADAAQSSEDAVVRARFNDLLWVARHGERPDRYARAAVDAYVELATRPGWGVMENADGLARALELTREVGDSERQARVEAAIFAAVEADLASADGGPGVSLTLLRALLDMGASDDAAVDALLARTAEVYGEDPFILDGVVDLRVRLPGADVDALRREQVAAWRAAAAEVEGFLRVHRLQHALQVAGLHRLEAEADELRVELQGVTEEDLDLQTFSHEVNVDRAELERFVAQFVDEASWERSLMRFGNRGPPAGSKEEIEAEVAEEMRAHPLRYLVTNVVLGPEPGNPITSVVDEADQMRVAAAERRARAAALWGFLGGDILDAIKERYGAPAHDPLTEFFTTEIIPGELAERIAYAVGLYWDGAYDEAAHLLVPRLEAVFRELARRLGVPIIQEPRRGRPGGVRGLGAILKALRGRFHDEDWRLYFENLLTDELGLNLRNTVAHGLVPQARQHEAVLLVHLACYLTLIRVAPADDPSPA
jgi:hypothetical protein